MKRIILHLLLATALVFQGVAGALAATKPPTMHGPCCPLGAPAGQDHHAKCPCPQKQACANECVLMCASGNAELIDPLVFKLKHAPSPSAQPLRTDRLLLARSETPPIRPPIA